VRRREGNQIGNGLCAFAPPRETLGSSRFRRAIEKKGRCAAPLLLDDHDEFGARPPLTVE